MPIGSIELNTAMTRLQDYASHKQNEDNKGMTDQSNFQSQLNKEVSHNINSVHKKDNADNPNKKFDAKDKGDGQYSGDGGKNRSKDEESEHDKAASVLLKSAKRPSFDIKV